MENGARLDGVGQQDLKEEDKLTTACNIFSWLRDLRTLTNESAQSDDAENIECFKPTQSAKTREEGSTEDSVDTCDTPTLWQKSSLGTAPMFASNLEKRQKSPPTWLSILEWLPTSEALQAGLSLAPPEDTTANGRVVPQGFSTTQLNKGTADRDEKKSESGDEGSGVVSRQHIQHKLKEEQASKDDPLPRAPAVNNSPLKNSPLAFACRKAEEDDENLERLAVVKALREWVLMQPVFLGRPVAPDNPTFYSLYLRWAKQQARDSDSDEEREQSPGRTSSIEVEDTFPVVTQTKSSTSQPGRQHKASVPSHLSSFEMYEESWIQGKRDSNHAAPSPHKHSFNSCGSKKKRVTEKLKAEQEQRRHSTSGPSFGASPMSCSKRKSLTKDEEEEAEADFVSTKRGNSAPSSRRGSLHLILNHDDEEPELPTPKPGSKGRGVPRKISMKQEDESDADVERRVAGKKRRRESGKESEVAEMDDPTFVPTSPPEVVKSENGKRGPGKKKKRAKKDDKLKHLRPATVESCHRCKNRKEYWMGCPIIEAHRYCKGCVERHFNLDYELYSAKSAEIWADGCPICKLTCQCAACRRRKEALDAGISPPAKRRKGEDSDYHNGCGQVDEEGNGRQRRTRSQSKEDAKEAKKINAKSAAIENRHLKKREKVPNNVDESEEEEEESESEQEDEEQEERKGSPTTHSNGRKSPSAIGSPQRVTRAQTRLRAKGKSPRKDQEEESEGEEPEEREIQPAAPSLVGSNGGVRKENGYYVLENSDNVEAFVGLTGAGSVLSRRYSGSSSLPRLPSVKILGGGW